MTRRPANPNLKADKGVVHRTGRDDRLEYTAARSATGPAPTEAEVDGRVIDGWRWTRRAWNDLDTSPSLHYRDVKDALDSPSVTRDGHTPGMTVQEHGLVRVVVDTEARTVISIRSNGA